MKKNIILLHLFLLPLFVAAQERRPVKPQGAHEAEFNSGEQKERSGEDETIETHDAGEQDNTNKEALIDPGSNTVGTDVSTASPSGSPAIATEGAEPDGTNTMQRATLNIAGSPLPGRSKASTDRLPGSTADRSEKRTIDPQPVDNAGTGEERERRRDKKKDKKGK
jgi:hypothetical protein